MSEVAQEVVRVRVIVNVRAPRVGINVEKRQRLEPLGGEAVHNAADASEQVNDATSRRGCRDPGTDRLSFDGGSGAVGGFGRSRHGGPSLLDIRGRASPASPMRPF